MRWLEDESLWPIWVFVSAFLAIESYNLFDLRPAVLLFSASVSLTAKMDINMIGCFTRMYEHINVKLGEKLQ